MTMLSDLSQRAESLGLERRSYALGDVEIRSDSADEFTFEGVAATVDAPYQVADMFGEYTETIQRGAFDASLRSDQNVALHVNHGWRFGGVPLATRGAQTLTLMADPNLRVRASIDPARPDAQIVRSAVRRGELPEMSVGFKAIKARDKWNAQYSAVVRTQVNLVEVSIVDQGANSLTSTAVRSLDDLIESLTDIDATEAEIRRGIASLEAMLPEVEVRSDEEPVILNPFAERDRQDRERLERKRHSPIFAA